MLKKVCLLIATGAVLWAGETVHLNIDDAFYEKSVKNAPNAKPVLVKDTDSALGRYNLYPKKLDIKMLARAHGHLCDGLVLSYVELSNLLPTLFADGVIDRTDLRVVAKNSPCLVDTSGLMTGARINHRRLSLDNSLGGSFIVQKISTGEAYKVELADTGFMKAMRAKEDEIKTKQKAGQEVTAKDVDEVEALAFEAMKHLLNTDPKKLLKITKLKEYHFHFDLKDIGPRSDIGNRSVGR